MIMFVKRRYLLYFALLLLVVVVVNPAAATTNTGGGLEVIGAGFPRTATSSLREALKILGYKTYHMQNAMSEKGHVEEWTKYLKGERTLNETAQFVYETNGYVWKELESLYPQAKIILTERSSAEKWWESASETVFIPTLLTRILLVLVPFWKTFGTLLEHLWYRTLDIDRPRHITQQDRDSSIAAYERNSAEVRAFQNVSKENRDRVLIFHATQGWEPLCAFLGKPIPENIPFPRINSRKDFSRHMQKHGLMFLIPSMAVSTCVGLLIVVLRRRRASKSPKVVEKKDD